MSSGKRRQAPVKKKKGSGKNSGKKATLVVVILLAVCAAAIIILYAAGVIRFEKVDTVVNNRTGVAYINYSDTNMIINSEGRVLESSETQPEDIPQLTGIEFTKIIEGENLEYEEPDAFEYAIKLVSALRTNEIYVREININADFEASAYVNKVTILFGTDNKTEIKAADLADFFDQVKDLKGTLHMEEVNDKLGYTFKQESENTAVIADPRQEEETTEEDTQSEEGNAEEAWVDEGQNEEEYYEEPVYEEEYYEEEYYEEPVYEEEYYEEPVYEEEYYEEPVYEEQY